MNIDLIPIGDNPPDNVNVVIEVPVGGEPVKYEFDKVSGALFVDRILHTPMRYPANYGFVPHTLSPDGDPIDALVVARSPFIPGCVVRARPIGVLILEDEHGGDEKLITVPVDSTSPYYSRRGGREDLPEIVMQQIEHFFTHYKDLEPEKWVRVGRWGDAEEAQERARRGDRARQGGRGTGRLTETFQDIAAISSHSREERRDGSTRPYLFRPPRGRGAGARPGCRKPEVAEAHRKLQRAYLERASTGDRPDSRSRSAESIRSSH